MIIMIKLTETFDPLNYKPYFKYYYILQTALHLFSMFIFVWNKIFCFKNRALFYIFMIWFSLAFDVTVLKVLYFWSTFYKVIGN